MRTDYRRPTDFGLSRVSHLLLNNWQLSSITAIRRERPSASLTAAARAASRFQTMAAWPTTTAPARTPSCITHPETVDTSASSADTVGPLLGNLAAYAAPQGLTLRRSGRDSANNPSRTNFNMALLKNLTLKRWNIELRAEAFNVFNHTQFRIYDPAHATSPTGNNTIGCFTARAAKAIRRLVQAVWPATHSCILSMRMIHEFCNLG